MRKWIWAGPMLVLLLVLNACGTGGAPKPTSTAGGTGNSNAEPEKLTKIKVGIAKLAGLTNAWAAQKEGIYKKHGLDVELVEFKNGQDAISAQRSGDVQIVASIPGAAMLAVEQGFDLAAVVQNESAKTKGPDTGAIQVPFDSKITSLSELTGKKISVSALNSQHTVALQQLLKKNGVDLTKVQFVELPAPAVSDALKSKSVDAVSTFDPFTTQLTTTKTGKVLAWYMADIMPEAPVGVFFARKQYIQANPKVIEGFTQSIKESIDFMLADQDRARKLVAEYTGLDPKLVQDMPLIEWNYKVKLDRWQFVVEMMTEAGLLKKPHKADEFFSEQIKPFIVK